MNTFWRSRKYDLNGMVVRIKLNPYYYYYYYFYTEIVVVVKTSYRQFFTNINYKLFVVYLPSGEPEKKIILLKPMFD